MLAFLIITAVQTLYWFVVTISWILESFLPASPFGSPLQYLLQPFSALVSAAPQLYLVFQCVFFPMVIICAVCILFLKRFVKRTKICAGISLLCLLLVFIQPSFIFASVLNFCISIPLLCFVIADYKQNKQIEIYRE